MGWAYGTNSEGREIGYGVEATCDRDGCEAEIDRGLSYLCGGPGVGGDAGCGRYFCGDDLGFYRAEQGGQAVQLCDECLDAVEDEQDDDAD